ncbi:hypothetical protein SAMN05720382_1255, partial [Polaromonas sp. JS666]
ETRKAGFLCSPKARYARGVCSLRAAKLRKHQKYPKERRPAVWVPPLRSGQPAVLEPSGVRLNSLRSDNAGPDPLVSALLGPARTGQSEAGTNTNKDTPRRVLVSSGIRFSFSHPLCMRRGAQVQADQGSRCLSEASLARPRLNRAPQVARSAAKGRRHQGRLFFGDFLLAKQKKVTGRRATPGQPPSEEERGG